MKNHLLFFAVMMFVVIFAACQREIDGEDENTPPDNTVVEKMISIDTSFSPGLDTQFIVTYRYDEQKRLSRSTITAFDPGAHTVDYEVVESYFYNGTAVYPYKISTAGTPAHPDEFSGERYLTYNANNIITRDSVRYFILGVPVKISRRLYLAKTKSRYLVETAEYDPATNILDYKDTTYANVNFNVDNLIAASDSSYSQLSGGLYNINRYTFYYDKKKNPTAKLRLPLPVHFSYTSDDGLLELANTLSKNNILYVSSYTWFAGAAPTIALTNFSYEYNSKGYPVSIRYPGQLASTRKDTVIYRTL